ETVSENSKSLRSPSTTTSALGSAARIFATKSWTTCACWCRCAAVTWIGGWRCPSSGSSPSFEVKWFAITNRWCPSNMNSRGRAPALPGAVRGGVRPGAARGRVRRAAAEDVVRVGRRSARPIDERDAAVGPEEEDLADVPARLAAVLVVDRIELTPLVRRASRARDRRHELRQRLVGGDDAGVRRARG